jgi:ribosomal protein S18 acetylase RimI-like enzyme
MQVVFRDAKKTDLPLIQKFTVETGWKDIPEDQRGRLDREKWSRHMVEVFENFAKRKNSKIFIAEDESHAFLGYLFVGESFDTMTGATHGFIYDIFVAEEYRGKGIGKILIEKAETYCREKGYPRILLMVSAENQPAIRLYTKTGFKTEHMHMGKELG